jgi:hypothetical protein
MAREVVRRGHHGHAHVAADRHADHVARHQLDGRRAEAAAPSHRQHRLELDQA